MLVIAVTARRDICVRIDENRLKLGVEVGLSMEQQDTRLCCDRQSNLVGDLETRTTFKPLLGEKHLNQTLQLGLILGRQLVYVRHVFCG
jgi:hypothetical protein